MVFLLADAVFDFLAVVVVDFAFALDLVHGIGCFSCCCCGGCCWDDDIGTIGEDVLLLFGVNDFKGVGLLDFRLISSGDITVVFSDDLI